MESCHGDCSHQPSACTQSLNEMQFERGIWGAAMDGDVEKVQEMLRKSIDPSMRDSSGYTALHYAARHGKQRVCEVLLKSNANPNAQTPGGATPLHRAAFAGNDVIVNMLLKFKADPMLRDSDGRTALHKAAEGQHIECCKLLLKLNKNLKEELDKRGFPPSYYVHPEQEELKKLFY
ncbi:ankyrin repeat domain-containing protein 39-like [Uloborus diversus]|uniref:ankyrin repeat domain-containing protein 39-like n=1 Tax=Uloborus diversus TaxID=327109 RepID=UPI002409F459|nr:ankyrin repeat domain-containing protein 39-like [Uloborus diversus]XP_054708822.1 ankyrin repeat domain-containing protein 39-like [Uloborus diversus]